VYFGNAWAKALYLCTPNGSRQLYIPGQPCTITLQKLLKTVTSVLMNSVTESDFKNTRFYKTVNSSIKEQKIFL